ncbi:MAG: TolC family outer membrane protein [Arcobacter sp.]|uniref:TolC family outer membrane protein n=1 Tax=Arcobacter sp. TaxID=1872629 RepID=UPI00258DFAAD|nr:TolC family outer membrane protein [Arcobacter sp.]MDD3009539.1 TolC family outer membrane protein [Arcobacter sp.]MDY3204832.1 TolC family outer membrane protein [Arcobacter sp.]
MKKFKYFLLIPFTLNALTLEEAVQSSLNTNPKIQQRISDYHAVKYDVDKAYSGYKPSVDLNAAIGPERTNQKSPNDESYNNTNKESSLVLTQNIFRGFNTEYTLEEQKSRVKTSQYYIMQEANFIVLNTIDKYLSVLKNKKLLDLELQNVNTHERIYKMIDEKISTGYGKRADLEQSESRKIQSYSNYLAQQNNYQDSIINFERMYGQIILAESMILPSKQLLPSDDLSELVELALTYNPTLQVENSNIKTQKAKYNKENSSFYPSVDLEVSTNYQKDSDINDEENNYKALLKFKYNLYNGGTDEANRLQNLQIVKSQQYSLNEQELAVVEKVKLAWMTYQYSQARIKCLELYAKLSKKTAESYAEEYHLGRRTSLDLLNVELEYTNAQKELIKTEFEYLYSIYRLLDAIGLTTYALNTNFNNNIDLPNIQNIDFNYPKKLDIVEYGKNKLNYSSIKEVCSNNSNIIIENSYKQLESKNNLEENKNDIPVILTNKSNKNLDNISIKNINFEYKSSTISEKSLVFLVPLSKILKEDSSLFIEVHGHTDNVGSDFYNQVLSEKRAKSVKEALINQGVLTKNITTFGHSFNKPIAENDTEEGRKTNRRIELIIKQEKSNDL